jgi:LmbE family N-acetylglucosaminyl deacetylase
MHIPDIESIKGSYTHVYVSPHLDDVVFSCGGRIAKQLGSGESVLVVTVFAGDAGEMKKPRGRGYDQVIDIKRRRGEDEKAMERLGVDYLWLDYIDSIFRHDLPLSRFGLHLIDTPATIALREALTDDIQRICVKADNKRLYLPLGVGQHEDHHILFQVSRHLINQRERGLEICFYEEVPYIFFPNILTCRLTLIGINTKCSFFNNNKTQAKSRMKEIVESYKAMLNVPTLRFNPLFGIFIFFPIILSVIITYSPIRVLGRGLSIRKSSQEIIDVSDMISIKLTAMLEYRTQLNILLSKDDIKNKYLKYSQSIEGAEGQYVERYWRFDQD